jgi:molybdopterin-guanine dinucleotide biosynthesis protein A
VVDEGLEEVVGVVLAGGEGRRLGGPKAGIELGGRPLISYPLEALSEAGLRPVVVAKERTPLPPLSVPVLREPDEPSHPLCGVLEALRHADDRPVLVCGCDMPFVAPELIAYLARLDAALAVPRAAGRLHPLLARYHPSLTPSLIEALAQRLPLQRAIAGLDPLIVQEEQLARFGDPDLLLFNVNEPQQLEEAAGLMRARRADHGP